MKKEILLKEIIAQLAEYPEDATVTVTTKQELKVVGFVFQRLDGQRQIVEFKVPDEK
jgi:phage terminase large subunit-like protein